MPETPLVHDSVATLLAGVTESELMETSGKSGAVLERVVIDGHEFVVKYLDAAGDWTMRAAGVPGGATLAVWERGILDALPDCFHQPIVGLASDDGLTTLLMHDVTAWIVPATDDVVPLAQHEGFLDHMAALHARFWQSTEDIDVVTPHRRYLELSPSMARTEAELGSEALVPRLVAQGWPLLSEVAPRAAEVVLPLAHDPGPLVAALARTPQTFVHGNWKLDNIGTDDEGRTVLLDWEVPGRATGLSDLAWYLAINCRRIPTSKEQALVTYRDALERHGVSTEGWWETQEALALLGALVLFGWEKALGGYDDELAWWEDRALRAAPLLAP